MAEGGGHGGAVAVWQDLVREGERRAGVDLPELAEAYLVFLLMRHLRDGSLAARTMALDWLQALELAGRLRAEALRDVGDRCLLIAGWYPRLAERRRVSRGYFEAIGRSAYADAADAARRGEAELFDLLARCTGGMVRVLSAAAARPVAGPARA